MKKFLTREEGQGLVEYALILVLVAIVVIAVLLLLGPVVGNVFSNVVAVLQEAGVASGGGGGPTTFSVTSISIDNVTYTGTYGVWRLDVRAYWSASCKDSDNQPIACSVTANCTLDNPDPWPDRHDSGSSPCSLQSGIVGRPITVQVASASAAGYTWDGSNPSDSSSVPF
jgi:pilus assembly protein Flp/PilA